MKKTLVALAALAASAAFAQSTVTISGVIDAGLESISDTATKMVSGRSATSNVTFAGVEDLGGGLKAKFQISSAFDAGSSTASSTAAGQTSTAPAVLGNGQLGNNGMFVGVESATLGSVILGRPLATTYTFSQTANGTKGVTGFAATDSLITGTDGTNTLAVTSSVYVGNAIQYSTPVMAGFSAQLEYSASETFGAKSNNAVGLKYANGPLTATLVRNNLSDFGIGSEYKYTVNQLAASYDFGVAKAFLTYQNINQAQAATDPNLRNYVLGVSAPVGPGVVWAQYGRASNDISADAATITGLGYKYSLSKRSTVYVNVGNKSNARLNTVTGAISSATTTAGSGYGIGLSHSF